MLVVIVMLGIAAAVAAPALRAPNERSAGAAAGALKGVYADARSDAAKRGAPVTVALNLATGEWIARLATEDGSIPETLRTGTLPLPAEGRLYGGRDGIARATFDALGRARADRVEIVHGEVRHAVTVDGWTGAARHAAAR